MKRLIRSGTPSSHRKERRRYPKTKYPRSFKPMTYDERCACIGFKPIDTAPRDGTEICVTADGEPLYLMSWNQFGSNPLVQDGRGIWWGRAGGFTWSEQDGHGPTHWAPTDHPMVAVLMQEQAPGSVGTKASLEAEVHKTPSPQRGEA